MKRLIFLPLVAFIIVGTACEQHPASELAGEHESGASGQTDSPKGAGEKMAAPQTPEGVPHNPSGANPVAPLDEHTKAEKAPAMNASEGPSPKTSNAEGASPKPSSGEAPQFFPGNK